MLRLLHRPVHQVCVSAVVALVCATLGTASARPVHPQATWSLDTTLPWASPTYAFAAYGDLVYIGRPRPGSSFTIEVHRYSAQLGRYELFEVLSDPASPTAPWFGFCGAADGPIAATISRPPFVPFATVDVITDRGVELGRQTVVLPGASSQNRGQGIAVDGRRIAALQFFSSTAPTLHILEPNPQGDWELRHAVQPAALGANGLGDEAHVALDGDIAVVAQRNRVAPARMLALVERDPLTDRWSERASVSLPEPLCMGVAIEGNHIAVATAESSFAQRAFLHILEWTPQGTFERRQVLEVEGVMHSEGAVHLTQGRLLASTTNETTVYERSSQGVFVLRARYRGLGRGRALLIGSNQGSGPPRVVGADGKVVRIVEYPPPPSPSGTVPTFDVRREVGVPICRPATQATPELTLFARPFASSTIDVRRAVEVTGVQPGARVFLFGSFEGATLPTSGGLLCLARTSLFLAAAPDVALAGTASFELRGGPVASQIPAGSSLFLQALVRTGGSAGLTHAVQFVP